MSDRVERYRVHGRNGYIVMESNRPYFRSKGLKHRKPMWRLVEGNLSNAVYLERIIDALEKILD